jgi:multidrug efflux system outer membrane protein
VTIPIFQGGRNEANLDIAKSSYRSAVSRYRAQVLTAYQDVENALADLRNLARQAEAQEVAITAARRSLQLTQQQHAKGAITFLDVLDAERTLLSDERTATTILGSRLQATVQLIKAIGGHWDEGRSARK